MGEVSEIIRRNWIAAMRNGDRLCLEIDKTKPAFGTDLNVEGTWNG